MKQKSYRTARLELRDFKVADWKAWVRAQELSLPKQDEWDKDPVTLRRRTRSLFKRELLAQRTRFKKRGVYLWSMFLKDTGEFVGWIDISTICRDPYYIANLGWFVLNSYRGRGYAREAVMKLISAAFSDLGFHRLEAAINPRNRVSQAMARSCGLHREGIKKFYMREDGKWNDMITFITTPELFYDR